MLFRIFTLMNLGCS